MVNKLVTLFKTKPKTCEGCKYLYSEGIGYANDERTGNRYCCALNMQDHLPKEAGTGVPLASIIQTTVACDSFSEGPYICLDVTGEEGPGAYTSDVEQAEAIAAHARRPLIGQPRSWGLANLIHLKPATRVAP